MGDALATYFEARSCYQVEAVVGSNGKPVQSTMILAKACYENLLKDGVKAKVAEIIKQHNKGKSIIMITAYDDFHMIKNALILGVNNYLLKPINKEEFKEVLTEITGNIGMNLEKS